MSYTFSDLSDTSAAGLLKHRTQSLCASWSSDDWIMATIVCGMQVDELASALVNLRLLTRPDGVRKQQTVEHVWSEPGKQLVDRFRYDGLVEQLGASESRAMRSFLSESLNIVPLDELKPMSST
jgi:hypothetical protein